MTILTVTTKRQITLPRDLLRHLGVEPGQKIEAAKLPGGRIELRTAQPTGTVDDFVGFLAGRTRKVATLEEIDELGAVGADR